MCYVLPGCYGLFLFSPFKLLECSSTDNNNKDTITHALASMPYAHLSINVRIDLRHKLHFAYIYFASLHQLHVNEKRPVIRTSISVEWQSHTLYHLIHASMQLFLHYAYMVWTCFRHQWTPSLAHALSLCGQAVPWCINLHKSPSS